MDKPSEQLLAHLIRTQRTAALGTLRDGYPFVSMVLYLPALDFSTFYLHISRLAHHTQDLLKDPRASLMISQTDDGAQDPQALARVSILGTAHELGREEAGYQAVQSAYLAKYPQAATSLALADFSLFSIHVNQARFVAGFGKIFNLKPEDFRHVAANP